MADGGKYRAGTVKMDLVSIDFPQIEHPFIYNSFSKQSDGEGYEEQERVGQGIKKGEFKKKGIRKYMQWGPKSVILN